MEDEREDVYSKVVRAGKRTYFFDVRSTRGNDLFLTITESKKRMHEDGGVSYEKHKIFLYKEDFDKFVEGLHHTLGKLEELRGSGEAPSSDSGGKGDDDSSPSFGDVEFDDLGKP
ncbi:MAG: DUF3276 family protein [Flavobacteriales bacterium]|nr:DUF3276 family protein [Flavobacteriales bacterium]